MAVKRVRKPLVSWRDGLLHIEAPGCIVNVMPGLTDAAGRAVTAVEVLADGDRYQGDAPWWFNGRPPRDRSAGGVARRLRVVQTGRAG